MIPPSPSAPLAGARTTTYGKLTTWLGTLEGPALQSLLTDIRSREVDVVVVYKVDRLTRSLADFAKLVVLFEAHGVSFVAVTQQFNSTSSTGRLTLNVLLSFAQFERELAGERIRDKFAASRRKCMSMDGTIHINPAPLTPAERIQYEGYVRRKEANAAILGVAKDGGVYKGD